MITFLFPTEQAIIVLAPVAIVYAVLRLLLHKALNPAVIEKPYSKALYRVFILRAYHCLIDSWLIATMQNLDLIRS